MRPISTALCFRRTPRPASLAAALLLLPALAACGETAGSATTPSASQVSISPDSARLLVGNERSFEARVEDVDGAALDWAVTWRSQDPSVVTVDPDGVARAVGAGETSIVAEAGSARGKADVTVPPPDGTVSTDGGSVVGDTGAAGLFVPPDAVDAPIRITMVPLDSAALDTLTPPPRPVPGTAYRFAPTGLDFARPATLSIAYDPSALDADTPANLLRLHELVDGAWKLVVGSRVVPDSDRVTGPIGGFSAYALLAVANHPPTARIEAPAEGASFTTADTVELRGSATDPEDGALGGGSLVWSAEPGGRLGAGDSLRVAGLSQGPHTLILAATDANGARGADSVDVTVSRAANRPPTVTIEAPPDGATFALLDTARFRATATDPEDGALPDSSIAWHSDLDGDLGAGRQVEAVLHTTGSRTITVSVQDSEGATAADTISILVPRGGGPPPSSPGTVSGRVERTQDAAGLGSVQVVLVSSSADTIRAQTDSTGGYAFAGVSTGTYTLAVAQATLPPFGGLAGPGTRSVTVGSGQSVSAAPFDFTVPEIGVRTLLSADTSSVGDTVTVTLEVDASTVPEPIGGVSARVDWNGAGVGYVDANASASDLDVCALNENDTATGVLRTSCASASGSAQDPLTVLTFRVSADAAGSVGFAPSIEELDALDPSTGRTTALQTFVIINRTNATWTIQ